MRRLIGFASAGAVVVALGLSTASAQQLTSVPDNAIAMVKVRNLQGVSKKLGVLFQQWGVTAMNPAMADPLAAMQGMGNVEQGLKADGEGGFIFFNPMTVQGQPGEPYVIMLPVTDYATFLKNFPDAQTEGEITSITLPQSQEPGYVTKWGSFAAISPNRGLVANRPQGTKPLGVVGKQFTSRDIIAYVNFNGFRNQAAAGLGFGRAMATQQTEQQLAKDPAKAKFAPLARVAMNQMFNGIDHVVTETQAITLGIDLSDQGVQITSVVEFAPDTYLAKLTSGWKTTPGTLISGIPAGSYALVNGIALDNATLTEVFDDITQPIITEAANLGDDGKLLIQYADTMKSLVKSVKTQTMAAGPSAAKAGEGPLFEMNSSTTGDAKAIVEAQKQVAALQEQFTKIFQMPNQPQQKAEFKTGVKSVAGVSFNQMTNSFAATNPNDPAAKMIETLYGKNGFSMLIGTINDTTLVSTTGTSDAALTSLVNAAKTNQDPLAGQANTAKVAAKLPQNAFMTMYIYGDQSLVFASKISEAFTGNPIAAKLPANTEPIGVAASTEGAAIKIDTYIPSPLVQSIVSAAMQEAVNQRNQAKKKNDGL